MDEAETAGEKYHKAYVAAFEEWIADEGTHWIGAQDAAWQAWMHLHERGLTPPTDLREAARWHQAQAAECYRKIGGGP